MGRHLASTRSGVGGGGGGCHELLERSHADSESECAIAIIRKEPVMAGRKLHRRRHEHGFVTGTVDLKKNFVLSLELNLAVIDSAR